MTLVTPLFRGLLCGAIVMMTAFAPAQAAYEMKRVEVTAVADAMASASYALTVTSVPVAGATGVCPRGAATTLGFWSILGPTDVPIRVLAGKNPGDPLAVDLSWTGQSSSFEVYRSTSPIDLVSPWNLYRTTDLCGTTDERSSDSRILFFKVVAPASAAN